MTDHFKPAFLCGYLTSAVFFSVFPAFAAEKYENPTPWSYQRLQRPAIPTTKDTTSPNDDLDRFILARLEKENLRPIGNAPRATLIRRASFDLRGLPPSQTEIEAFLRDPAPDEAAFATWDAHIPAGSVVNQPLHMVDWLPMLAKLAGASMDSTQPLDGRDIWPVLAEAKPAPHDLLLLNIVGREGAVRAGDWKLVRNGQSGSGDDQTNSEPTAAKSKETKKQKRLAARNAPDVIELFNIATDPSESKNLASEHPDKARELSVKLDQFAKEAVPPILKPENENKTNR